MDQATEAQVSAMQAKLAARVKQLPLPTLAQPSGAGESPKEKAALEWEKPVTGATGVKTKCGRYACAKVTVMGKTFYELSKLVPGHWFIPLHSRLDSFMQAQTLAQQDADK